MTTKEMMIAATLWIGILSSVAIPLAHKLYKKNGQRGNSQPHWHSQVYFRYPPGVLGGVW